MLAVIKDAKGNYYARITASTPAEMYQKLMEREHLVLNPSLTITITKG